MSTIGVKFRTALALGPANLLRVARYRASLHLGLNPVRRIRAATPVGMMFRATPAGMRKVALCQALPDAPVGMPAPAWHENSFTGVVLRQPLRNWWEIPDFDRDVGDIKGVWENSRFDWVVALVQHACCGDADALATLETWLADWCRNNPPYQGANWKCGQEASVRVMHLATAAMLLGQVERSEQAVLDLVELHLARIAPTMGYAIAQDNNHGTSEAAALFIGGSWLEKNGRRAGRKWSSLGRRWLENRAAKLIAEDGTFSQYSVNYHRFMLDTFSLAEVWRRALGSPEFSRQFSARARAAAHWLRSMVSVESGDAPNIGANDGARLVPLSRTDYRDFRPSVQLATMLFSNARAYGGRGDWDLPLEWLGIGLDGESPSPFAPATMFDDGGFAVLRRNDVMAVLRYPRFRFRPSQADALHVDLWQAGFNLLRDAGTYSYNVDDRWLRYFPGTEAHNTMQFDERDQMPRLGRFLFGDWLRTNLVEPAKESEAGVSFGAGYRDSQGASHFRRIDLSDGHLRVEDRIEGFKRRAVLRWRLAPGEWRLAGNRVVKGSHSMEIASSVPVIRMELLEGWESRYYFRKTSLPVLEVEVDQSGTLVTEYRWDS